MREVASFPLEGQKETVEAAQQAPAYLQCAPKLPLRKRAATVTMVIPTTQDRCALHRSAQAKLIVPNCTSRHLLPEYSEVRSTVHLGTWCYRPSSVTLRWNLSRWGQRLRESSGRQEGQPRGAHRTGDVGE